MDSNKRSREEINYMDSNKRSREEINYMDSNNLSEEDMKHMSDKASNWGYTELTPLTEDENQIMNTHVKYLKEMEKNYKPTKPNAFPEPFPNVKISDEIKKLFLSGEQVTNFTPERMSQNGGTVFNRGPSTLLPALMQLKRHDNTIIIIFKQVHPPNGQIILDNGTHFVIDVYMFTTANPHNIELVNPFQAKFPGTQYSNITDTLASSRLGEGVRIAYRNETFRDPAGVPIEFHNNTHPPDPAPSVVLHDHVFLNYQENAFNVGFEQPPIDVIQSVVHTNEDIRDMRCITKNWDGLMNTWRTTGAYLNPALVNTWLARTNVNEDWTYRLSNPPNDTGPLNCRTTPFDLGLGQDGRMRLVQEIQVKDRQYNEFIDKKGRITGLVPNTRITYAANNLNSHHCNTFMETDVVYRGMVRPYVMLTADEITNLQLAPNETWYQSKGFFHTTVNLQAAIEFANTVVVPPATANRIIYRICPIAGCPYYAYDTNQLRSEYPNECEIIFKPGAVMRRVVAARQIDGYPHPVEDVELGYSGDVINPIDNIHGQARRNLHCVYLRQVVNFQEIAQVFQNGVGVGFQAAGGKRTKYKKSRTFKKSRKFKKSRRWNR
jgi:hypothetical protein